MLRLGGLVAGVVLLTVPAFAQKASAPTRDQVRLRILDGCVLSQSGPLPQEGAGPKCGCYAGKISKAMTDEEIAGFTKALPKRLSAEAPAVFESCK